MAAPKHILVLASYIPASDADPHPGFVRDQVVALKKEYPSSQYSVLAAHDARSHAMRQIGRGRGTEYYKEYRFHYFWPRSHETLAMGGILPALSRNPAYYLVLPFFVAAEFFALLKLTRRLKPDIIYAHWFTPQGINAGFVSALTHTPFVYTSHSSDVAVLRRLPLLGRALVRHFSRRARAITVVSRPSLERLREFFDEKEWSDIGGKVAVISMGVEARAGTRSTKARAKGRKNILFIGRLVEKKGVQYLLPAFAPIQDLHPRAALTIAGDGPWLARLQEQARQLNLRPERITFAGYVTGDAKEVLIANADVCVVPSVIAANGDAEGLPVALLEGLAAGKICIATNESGAADIMTDEVDGFLVPHKNARRLATALDRSLRLSSKQLSRMQRRALKTSRRFAWPQIARKHYHHLFER